LKQSTANIDNLRCLDNRSKYNGGCVYLIESKSNITNSDFYKNKADAGSALYLDSVTDLTMKNNIIRENQNYKNGTIFSK